MPGCWIAQLQGCPWLRGCHWLLVLFVMLVMLFVHVFVILWLSIVVYIVSIFVWGGLLSYYIYIYIYIYYFQHKQSVIYSYYLHRFYTNTCLTFNIFSVLLIIFPIGCHWLPGRLAARPPSRGGGEGPCPRRARPWGLVSYICVYIYIYVYVYVLIYSFICLYLLVYIFVDLSIYVHMYMCIYIYIYIHIRLCNINNNNHNNDNNINNNNNTCLGPYPRRARPWGEICDGSARCS